jgi:uncharacterized protein
MNEPLTIFIAPAIAFVLATILKNIMYYRSQKKLKYFGDGGAVSGHTATVSSLTLSVYFLEGFSPLFFVTLFFSAVVINDAYGVRGQSNNQARVINAISKKLRLKEFGVLSESIGHTKLQALAGIVVGLLTSAIVFMF